MSNNNKIMFFDDLKAKLNSETSNKNLIVLVFIDFDSGVRILMP